MASWIEMINVKSRLFTLLSRLMWPRGLKYLLHRHPKNYRFVEAYVASWIEILLNMMFSFLCLSRGLCGLVN